MTEVMSAPERVESKTVEPFEIIDGLCRERGVALSLENLATLIPSITYEDLKDHHVGKKHGIEPLFLVDENGILIDNRFKDLSREAQRHGLSHELGHLIEDYLVQYRPDLSARLHSVAKSLAPETVSRYSAHMDSHSPDNDETQVNGEKIAELMAQYMTSDGTFLGMVNGRLLQERRWAEGSGQQLDNINQGDQEAAELSQYLSGENPDISELVKKFPQLIGYYNAFTELDSILRDPETFEPLSDLLTEGFHFEGNLVDYDEMVMDYEPEASPDNTLKPVAPEKSLLAQFFDFSSVFGGKSE